MINLNKQQKPTTNFRQTNALCVLMTSPITKRCCSRWSVVYGTANNIEDFNLCTMMHMCFSILTKTKLILDKFKHFSLFCIYNKHSITHSHYTRFDIMPKMLVKPKLTNFHSSKLVFLRSRVEQKSIFSGWPVWFKVCCQRSVPTSGFSRFSNVNDCIYNYS